MELCATNRMNTSALDQIKANSECSSSIATAHLGGTIQEYTQAEPHTSIPALMLCLMSLRKISIILDGASKRWPEGSP